jgi:16S rRNA (guanine527-N7)-methyltransferase
VCSSSPDVAVADALAPYLSSPLNTTQLEQVRTYLDLLLRWSARINLTAVRGRAQILTRHFGESFFLASLLASTPLRDAIDVGSGAGFPGIPLKIFSPNMRVTLIESNNKKATFLKEVIRSLTLTDINVFAGRAQQFSGEAELVTMRAVEKFQEALPAAFALLRRPGRLALLIGSSQVDQARKLASNLQWEDPISIPQSRESVTLIGVAP